MEKVLVENKGCFQALSPDANFVRVRLYSPIQRLLGRQCVTVFSVALTKEPTATELHGGEPKVSSECSIGNLNSTPPISYYQGKDFTGPTTWLQRFMGTSRVGIANENF